MEIFLKMIIEIILPRERERERGEREREIEVASSELQEIVNTIGECFRSLSSTNRRENSAMTVETARMIYLS